MENIVISDQEIAILLAQWEAAKKDIENKFKVDYEAGKKVGDLERYCRF